MDKANGGPKKRPNGHGSIQFVPERNRWRARYTIHTDGGPQRKSVYGRSEQEAMAKMYEALGWWEDYQRVLDEIDEESGEHVYFIQGVVGGPVKIGTATDVDRRLKTIQACSPVPLCVLHVLQGAGRIVETKLHQRFALFRLHGEWFDNRPELLGYVQKLKVGQDRRLARAGRRT